MVGRNQRTAGLEDTMGRPGLVNRALGAMVDWAENLNRKYAKYGDRPVLDLEHFPWTADIEREWPVLRAELDRLLVRKEELPGFHEIISEVRSISADQGWKTFLFTGFGATSDEAAHLCPETWRVSNTIPGLKTALFSILEPGKHLAPHRGAYNGVLRLHLGLLVPDAGSDQLGIRVGDEICEWHEGKAVIFDDCFEHEAWNRTDQVRVVLMIDFVKPLRFPASMVNWLILHLAPFTPYIREAAKAQKQWERKFLQPGPTDATRT
jgi:ornithine lipid ester-linked acyl 2-hydroxylase